MTFEGISKCRTCLSENQNMKLISAEYIVCGELLTISKIISSCTSLQITSDERYPQYICESCLQDANTAYSFRKRCVQTDNYLKSQLEENQTKKYETNLNTTNYSDNYDSADQLDDKISQDEKVESYYQCTKCPIKFITQEDLKKHSRSMHMINKSKLTCNFCGKRFNSETRLNKHMNTHARNTLRAMRRSTRTTIKKYNENNSNSDENNYSESDNHNSNDEWPQQEIKQEVDTTTHEMDSADIKSSCNDINDEHSGYKILKHAKEKNENGVYECICCTETFINIADLKQHMPSHTSFKCKLCNKNFTLLSNLRRHLKSHNSDIKCEVKEQIIKDDTSSEIQFKCIACNQVFSRRKFLSEHLKSHKEFTCPICNVKFTFATNLRKHINWHKKPKDEIRVWKQPPTEKRTCDVCFKVFKYRPSMLKHRKKHEFSGKICKFCDQICENSIKLYKHMEQKHEHEKNIICSVCGKKFFREWNLKMHMIVHSGAKPYMCEICGASFALGGNLASHKRLHTGVKPYKCEICGREFTQQAALRSHEAGHSNRRDFVCPECGAAFSRAGAMRNHRKRHETTKSFACTMCDKRFTFSSERKRHMAIHTGERNYVCDFCGKAFNRPTNLTVHRRIHTGEQPYKCDICGKGFVQAHCMRTHRNTHNREAMIAQGPVVQHVDTIVQSSVLISEIVNASQSCL